MSQDNTLVLDLARLLHVDDINEATLQLCFRLIDQGVDPKKLAESIGKIKKEISI